MKLQEWMTANGYSLHDMAAAVEVSPRSVANWLDGSNVPNSTAMRRIIELTGGAVRPDAFFELPVRKAK